MAGKRRGLAGGLGRALGRWRGLKEPKRGVQLDGWRDRGIEATYIYGRADGRGVPRFLVMDDWERGESLRGDKRMKRGWTCTYVLMTRGQG